VLGLLHRVLDRHLIRGSAFGVEGLGFGV